MQRRHGTVAKFLKIRNLPRSCRRTSGWSPLSNDFEFERNQHRRGTCARRARDRTDPQGRRHDTLNTESTVVISISTKSYKPGQSAISITERSPTPTNDVPLHAATVFKQLSTPSTTCACTTTQRFKFLIKNKLAAVGSLRLKPKRRSQWIGAARMGIPGCRSITDCAIFDRENWSSARAVIHFVEEPLSELESYTSR